MNQLQVSYRTFVIRIACLAIVGCDLSIPMATCQTPKQAGCYFSLHDAQVSPFLMLSSGNPNLDSLFVVERRSLRKQFQLSASLRFIAAAPGSTNAHATPERADVMLQDGTVVIGTSFIGEQIVQGTSKDLAIPVAAIIAHEYAHLLQYKNETVVDTINAELQADYLAGWYISRRNPDLDSSGLKLLLRPFYENGDIEFNNPDHHGTPGQRVSAVAEGYSQGKRELREAYAASLAYAGVDPKGRLLPGVSRFPTDDTTIALSTVLADQPNKFANLRGPLRADHKASWAATVSLPDAEECTVDWFNEYQGEYNCTMFESLDEQLIAVEWTRLVDNFRIEIATEWKYSDGTVKASKRVFQNAVFTSPKGMELNIEYTTSTIRKGYEIAVTIPFDQY